MANAERAWPYRHTKTSIMVAKHASKILLVNAQHIKHVPGRKTDVIDSAWIAQLLQCGLLRGSFGMQIIYVMRPSR